MNFIGPRLSGRTFVPQIELQQRRADQQSGARGRSSAAGAAASASSMRFVSSPARRKANIASFIEKSRGDPASAAAMRDMFAKVDVLGGMERAIRPLGLRTDDVADAYAVWWMSSWGAAHGDRSTPDRTTAQAVRAQTARAMASTPQFGAADDVAKQEYAEAMLVQAAMIDGMLERYHNDAVMGPKVAAAVRQGARASGLDLDAMTLTPQGFVAAR
ncbi:DUF6683 family protein [Sphingomonas sp. DT-51]|uniref:DUF6683 family protein n=1 Tax=Sphingomonas sp. DT-51 TaxID=3396165 RepID=UPI003F540878